MCSTMSYWEIEGGSGEGNMESCSGSCREMLQRGTGSVETESVVCHKQTFLREVALLK